jgi:hypothetical protein
MSEQEPWRELAIHRDRLLNDLYSLIDGAKEAIGLPDATVHQLLMRVRRDFTVLLVPEGRLKSLEITAPVVYRVGERLWIGDPDASAHGWEISSIEYHAEEPYFYTAKIKIPRSGTSGYWLDRWEECVLYHQRLNK